MKEPRSAIILVHGIGDQIQGSTLNSFNRLLRPFAQSPDYIKTLRTLHPNSEAEFNYFTERAEIRQTPVVIAEMFWSDLSAIRSGFLANLRNFSRLAADAPDIIYASLGPDISKGAFKDHLLLRILRCMVCLAFWTIYFPIVAYNIAYAALFMWLFVFRTLNSLIDDSRIELNSPADLTFAAGSVLSLGVIVILLRSGALAYLKSLLMWIAAAMVAVAILAWSNIAIPHLAALTSSSLPTLSTLMGYPEAMTYQDYSAMIRHLNVLWFIPLWAGAIYLLALPLLIALFRHRWRGLLLGYATMFLAVRLWLIVIITAWLTVISVTLDADRLAKVLDEILRSGKYVSLIWLDVVIVAVVFAIAYVRHEWKSRSKRTAGRDARYSRLIVPTAVLILPLGLSCLLVAATIVCDCPLNPNSCETSPCLVMTQVTKVILESAGLILVMGGILIQLAHSGFKVASDIVNYFKTDVAHTHPNPLAAMALAYRYNPRSETGFGANLRRRFLTICRDLTANVGGVDRLFVVAHSLGTVIALDALRSDKGIASLPGVEFNLFTMGSPYKNIFNFYFPHLFPALDRKQLPSVAALTNIYRENDYVGTQLSDGSGFVSERRKGRKGHFGYFEDPDVVWELFKFG